MSFTVQPFNPAPNPTLETEEAGIDECLAAVPKAEAVFMWRAGFHYRRVMDAGLWKDGGHKNGAAWGKKRYARSATTLKNAAGVCRVWVEQVAVKYDFTCLVLVLVWANAKGLAPLPKDPGELIIPVPTPKGVANKPFPECSTQDIKKAIKALKKPKSQELPPEDAERMTRFQAALADVVTKGQPFPIKAVVKKNQVTYQVLPMEHELFDKVIAALSKARAAVPLTPPPSVPIGPPPVVTFPEEDAKKLHDAEDALAALGRKK
jgi:hypothetical protein